MVAASGNAPDSPRLQRGANLSQLHSHGPSFRNRTRVFRLSSGCYAIQLRRMEKMVARPSAALGVSSSQARRIAVFLARENKKMLEMWLRGPDSNRRFAAYETAALPLGYPAVING